MKGNKIFKNHEFAKDLFEKWSFFRLWKVFSLVWNPLLSTMFLKNFPHSMNEILGNATANVSRRYSRKSPARFPHSRWDPNDHSGLPVQAVPTVLLPRAAAQNHRSRAVCTVTVTVGHCHVPPKFYNYRSPPQHSSKIVRQQALPCVNANNVSRVVEEQGDAFSDRQVWDRRGCRRHFCRWRLLTPLRPGGGGTCAGDRVKFNYVLIRSGFFMTMQFLREDPMKEPDSMINAMTKRQNTKCPHRKI